MGVLISCIVGAGEETEGANSAPGDWFCCCVDDRVLLLLCGMLKGVTICELHFVCLLLPVGLKFFLDKLIDYWHVLLLDMMIE